MQREATASATQLAALGKQHSSLLSTLEAQDAELGEELERSKAQLTAALVRPGPLLQNQGLGLPSLRFSRHRA